MSNTIDLNILTNSGSIKMVDKYLSHADCFDCLVVFLELQDSIC